MMQHRLLTAGLALALLMSSVPAVAAEAVTAQPSTQTFYLQLTAKHQIDLRAYAIGGHNYVQLRDIGRQLDFAVNYLAEQNLVVVDGVSPYQEDPNLKEPAFSPPTAPASAVPTTQAFLFNGKEVNLTAYAIEGHNYVMLRDVGRALDFSVEYDGAANSVTLDRLYPYVEEKKPVPEGVVVIPQSDENFILKEGDKVLCDDGSIYEITDMSRFDKSMFAEGPLPPLPEPICDWSLWYQDELPKVEVRRYTRGDSDDLFVLNLYETRRMQYTIFNLLGANPETWENGAPKLNYTGTAPLANVHLTLVEDWEPQVFWPWRVSNIETVVNSRPVSQFYVQAWDHYNKGSFLETQYQIQSF